MFFRTCVVGWELGKEGGSGRATVPQKSASPWHSLCTPIAVELGRVISFHCHGRNVSFLESLKSWILGKKSLWFPWSSWASGGHRGVPQWFIPRGRKRLSHWERAVACPGGHPWPEWAQRSSWGQSVRFQIPGRGWVGQRDHKVHAQKTVKKEWSPDSFFPSSPFLRKGRVLKIQNCLPGSKRITSDKSGLPCDLCANNNTEHLLCTNICHTLKCALCLDYLIYLHSSSFKYYHSHWMWKSWGLEKKIARSPIASMESNQDTKAVLSGSRVGPFTSYARLPPFHDFYHNKQKWVICFKKKKKKGTISLGPEE